MSQNRNRWLDIAKGIAIILMVAGHTPIPSVMSHFIYAFHMPLFFISSGLVSNYEKYSLVDYIKHKSYTLLLPFVCYSTIVAFFNVFYRGIGCHTLYKMWLGGMHYGLSLFYLCHLFWYE